MGLFVCVDFTSKTAVFRLASITETKYQNKTQKAFPDS